VYFLKYLFDAFGIFSLLLLWAAPPASVLATGIWENLFAKVKNFCFVFFKRLKYVPEFP